MLILEEKKYLEKIRRYIPDSQEREWIGGNVIAPYDYENSHKITIYVLEGSPVRGWVIFNYGTNEIHAYDINGRRVKRFDLIIDSIKDL